MRIIFMAAMLLMVVSGTFAQSRTPRRLDIKTLFLLVDSGNRTLRVRDAAVSTAKEGVAAARAQRLPDIDASLSASYNGNALLMDRHFDNVHGLHSPHFGNSFALEARQLVYAGGAIDAGIKGAELGLRQAEVQAELSRENQRFIALGQYLELQKLANREQVVKSNIELTKKLIGNITDRQRQGVALKNDITRYQLQMQNLQLALTKIANSRTIINHQLCNTLNVSPSDSIVPIEDVTAASFAKDGELAWQSAALDNAQSLKMSDIGIDMAHNNEKLAKSEMLPKVAVVANDAFNGPITFELPPVNKNLNVWYVGVGVQYSLSSLFKSNKKLRQARLATQQATLDKQVALENVNNQVQQAYTDYLQSYVELETQQKSVQLARENYQVVNDRYLNQLALITDMIDASNTRLDAELSEVDAKINIAYAYYKMKYIAGNL